jgi:phosphonate transport system substrate-binding protein
MNQKLLFSIIAAMAIIGVATALFSQNAEAQSLVPEWVKNNAAWWAEGRMIKLFLMELNS